MNREKYEDLAKEAVSLFVNNDTPLEDGIVKIARRESLNPEQVRRIVEMANTGAFLDLFDKTGGDDRMVEFSVADPDSTVDKYHGGPISVMKVSGDCECEKDPEHDKDESRFFDDVADENATPVEDEPVMDDGATKVASWEPRVATHALVQSSVRTLKAMDVLRDKVAHAGHVCTDIAASIASQYRGIYSREKLATWEADSLAAHGPPALYCINAVRASLKLAKYDSLPQIDQVKIAADKHLYGSYKALNSTREFLSELTQGVKAQAGLNLMENKYGH